MSTAMPQKDEPLVSVIIPTHNRASTLTRAIRSVLAQTYTNLELIIADDASTDTTPELVAAISDRRLKYVRHEHNKGAGSARNLGLAQAKGDYIAFQDSDDEWVLYKLQMQLEALRAAGDEYGAAFGGKLIYGRDSHGNFNEGIGGYRPYQAQRIQSGWMTSQLIVQNLIGPPTLIVKAAIMRKTGGFDERLPNNEDWEFALRLSTKTKILFINRPVVVVYASEGSISFNLSSKARSFMLITKKHETLLQQNAKVFGRHLCVTGRYLHRLHRYRSARKYFRRALRADPWSHKTWACLLLAWVNELLPLDMIRDMPNSGGRRGPASGQLSSSRLSVVPNPQLNISDE